MALADRKILKERAADTLIANEAAAKRTVLLYAGILAAAQLLVALLSILLGFLTEKMTQDVSGLDVLDTVAAMETAQTVLNLLLMILPTFWTMGYIFVLLRMTLGEHTHDGMLLQGFRKFGPVIRKALIEGMLQMGVLMMGISLGSTIVSMTPLARPMLEVMEGFADMTALTDQQLMELMEASGPAVTVSMLFGAVFLLPLMYRLRVSNYLLMDYPQYGAVFSLTMSYRVTRGSAFRLFKLELSFLWYYLPLWLAGMLPTLATFLPRLGIQLPIGGTLLSLLVLAVSLLLQLALQYAFSNKVEMTFVHAYRTLMEDVQLPTAENPTAQQ